MVIDQMARNRAGLAARNRTGNRAAPSAGSLAALAVDNRPTVVDRMAGNRAGLAAGNWPMVVVPAAATVSGDACLTDFSRFPSPVFS
jgi:hypothetical protein